MILNFEAFLPYKSDDQMYQVQWFFFLIDFQCLFPTYLFFIDLHGSSVIFRTFEFFNKFLSDFRRAIIMKSFCHEYIQNHNYFSSSLFTFSRSHEKIWIGRHDIFKDSIFFLFSFILSWSWARHRKFHESNFNRPLKSKKYD